METITFKEAQNKKNCQWIDIRSPREYAKGHLTNAINIPLFNNEQFKELGTIYNEIGQEEAIKTGEYHANERKKQILEAASKLESDTIIVYCARGGMRSKGVQFLLENSGFTTYRINNGYKSIRKRILESLNEARKLIIIAGSTGTGKTNILRLMKKNGYPIIDLEKYANHRGSAFGDIGLTEQATQQQFENDLWGTWKDTTANELVYIESESRKIGKVVIPSGVWKSMLYAKYIKIDMDIDRRIQNLLDEYGEHPIDELKKRVSKISRKLGEEAAKQANRELDKNNYPMFCKILLRKYYDKLYQKSYDERETLKEIITIKNESNEYIIEKIIDISK